MPRSQFLIIFYRLTVKVHFDGKYALHSRLALECTQLKHKAIKCVTAPKRIVRGKKKLEGRINLAFCSGYKVFRRREKLRFRSDDSSRCHYIVGTEKLINIQMLSPKMLTAVVFAV